MTAILPATDEYGTPVEKMPRCPKCNADELGMIWPAYAYCYACSYTIDERGPGDTGGEIYRVTVQ